jgi:ubiquinone biosynthesis O-methyltransferase
MLNRTNKKLYEVFHQNTQSQSHLIDKHNYTYHIIVNVIDKYLESSKNVLDIGCGSGTLTFYIANKGKNVLGIDISSKAIKACRQSAAMLNLENKTRFEVMSFPNQIPKGKFDLVIFMEVIEHLDNDDLSLNKIYSLLKKDGILIISTPSKNAPMYRMGYAKEFDKRVGHLRRYTKDELVKKCIRAKFSIIETKRTEGLFRNFLFLNPYAGKMIRFIKYPLSLIAIFIDQIFLSLFGESDIFVIVQKIEHKK